MTHKAPGKKTKRKLPSYLDHYDQEQEERHWRRVDDRRRYWKKRNREEILGLVVFFSCLWFLMWLVDHLEHG